MEFLRVYTASYGVTIKHNKIESELVSREKIDKENKHVSKLANYFSVCAGKENRITVTDYIDKNNPDEIVHILSLEEDSANQDLFGLESQMDAFNNEVVAPFLHYCSHIITLSKEEKSHTISLTNDEDFIQGELKEEMKIASEPLFKVLDNLFIKNNKIKSLVINDKQHILPIESFTSEILKSSDEKPTKMRAKIDATTYRNNSAIAYNYGSFDQTFVFPPKEKENILEMQRARQYFELEFDWSGEGTYPILTNFPKVLKQIEMFKNVDE